MRLVKCGLGLYFLFLSWPGHAEIACSSPPEQISKNSKVAVEAAVGKLGPVSAGSFKTQVERTTVNLLGTLPAADQVYLQQMLFAAFCSSVRDDKGISDTQKSKALRDYAQGIRDGFQPPKGPAESPRKPAEPPKKSSFNQLNKVFGLPRDSQIGWGASMDSFNALTTAEERAASEANTIRKEDAAVLGGLSGERVFYFKNSKLDSVRLTVAGTHSHSEQFNQLASPSVTYQRDEGDVNRANTICSDSFWSEVQVRAATQFTKKSNPKTEQLADPSYSLSNYECNKYGCSNTSSTGTTRITYAHPESADITLIRLVQAKNSVAKIDSARGWEFKSQFCAVSYIFKPATGSDL